MRTATALLALAVLACSGDSTGSSDDTGVVITPEKGVTFYANHSANVTLKNTTTSTMNVRGLDCLASLQRKDGDSWTSLGAVGEVCNYYEVTAGTTVSFSPTLPNAPGTQVYRYVSSVEGGTSKAYSAAITVVVAPPCTPNTPAGSICTPQEGDLRARP